MSLSFSAHISWLFTEHPYLERPAAARRAGFNTIETAWPEHAEDRGGLVDAVGRAGLSVALVNLPAGDVAGGERGFINDPAREEDAWQAFLEAAELAGRLGARRLNVLAGRSIAGVSIAEQRESVVCALRRFGPEATRLGLSLVLEPLNDRENPGYLAATPEQALDLIDASGRTEIGVLFDTHHVSLAGGDPLETIQRCAGRIGHVQVSGFPGRGSPGSGTLDLWLLLDALDAAGYEGAVGLEYDPGGPTEPTLAFLADERARGLL